MMMRKINGSQIQGLANRLHHHKEEVTPKMGHGQG